MIKYRKGKVMNMSYCRFENTSADLEDCCAALENGEGMSDREWIKAQYLKEQCERYLEAFDGYERPEEDEEL